MSRIFTYPFLLILRKVLFLNTIFQSDNGRSPFGVPDNRELSPNFITVKYACGLPEAFDVYGFFFCASYHFSPFPYLQPWKSFPKGDVWWILESEGVMMTRRTQRLFYVIVSGSVRRRLAIWNEFPFRKSESVLCFMSLYIHDTNTTYMLSGCKLY